MTCESSVNADWQCAHFVRRRDKAICVVGSSINVLGSVIPVSREVSILGVIFDSKLNFAAHIESLSSRCLSLLYTLKKIRRFLTRSEAATIYTSIIRPRLEYCSILFLGLNKSSQLAIEKCQSRAIRIILCVQFEEVFSVSQGRLVLNLPTLSSRRESRFCKLVRDAASRSCPTLVSRELGLYPQTLPLASRPTPITRNTGNVLFDVKLPSVRTNYGKRSLHFQAAMFCRGLHDHPFGAPCFT